MEPMHIDPKRLVDRLAALAALSPLEGEGSCRVALTDADKAGRDLFVSWLEALGLEVRIDVIGNIVGVWSALALDPTAAPVMMGSHLDTVRTGGRYDGAYGVVAGLEVIETLAANGVQTARPLAVAAFTNEEGARYAPDMMGSLVYVGGLDLWSALETVGIDGTTVAGELARIGYVGPAACPGPVPHAFVELHIEQGPVLEHEDYPIGAVTGVQGISWQELTIVGQSNHAGTTPMYLRHDPGYAAARIAAFVRELALEIAGQVGTVGRMVFEPNLVNVVPASVTMTVDVRNTDEDLLQQAEKRLAEFVAEIAASEGLEITTRSLARFEPVAFDEAIIGIVEMVAWNQGLPPLRMPSGAGHDAQMLARVCPTGMIFVPSHKGLSHNPAEYTASADLEAGANVLLEVVMGLANT